MVDTSQTLRALYNRLKFQQTSRNIPRNGRVRNLQPIKEKYNLIV